MDMPFFSVVIPTHNRSLLLKRAVDSVLNQTYANFEIIIVDDHSTDDTFQAVNSFSDNRIQYKLNSRSKGACGARNTGIFAAKGEWVAFLDDDDIWYNGKLKFQHELILNSKSSVGLICSDYAIYEGNGKKLKIIKNRPSGWVKDKVLYGGVIGCLSCICVRANVLIKINGFDESFPSRQDQDLYIRLAEVSEFAAVAKTLVCIYQENRERIGKNYLNKLSGHLMLRHKFDKYISKSIRLKHRHESDIFIYALLLKNRLVAARSFPWFLLGIFIDFPHCLVLYRKAVLLSFRNRRQIRSLK